MKAKDVIKMFQQNPELFLKVAESKKHNDDAPSMQVIEVEKTTLDNSEEEVLLLWIEPNPETVLIWEPKSIDSNSQDDKGVEHGSNREAESAVDYKKCYLNLKEQYEQMVSMYEKGIADQKEEYEEKLCIMSSQIPKGAIDLDKISFELKKTAKFKHAIDCAVMEFESTDYELKPTGEKAEFLKTERDKKKSRKAYQKLSNNKITNS